MKPLNPGLYNLLKRRFHDVNVANPGIKAHVVHTRSAKGLNCEVKGGERYTVCCPECGDTRHRLWFSYLYHTYDQTTGRMLDHLIWCYNCEGSFMDFYELELSPLTTKFHTQLGVNESLVEFAEPKPVKLPGKIVTTDKLDADHFACDYLYSRHFDPVVLGKIWSVGYCSQSKVRAAFQRLVIPMFVKGKLMGWQARKLLENSFDKTPKFYSAAGMRRNSIVYNYDLAQDFPVGIITEGPFDALRIGPPGMALLGKSLSEPQVRLLGEAFKNKYLIVMTDSDKAGSQANERIMDRLTDTVFKGVESIRLKDGDPADHSFAEIWQIINSCITSKFGLPAMDPKICTERRI